MAQVLEVDSKILSMRKNIRLPTPQDFSPLIIKPLKF